jgi:sigma-B regulation protein RsbU (phosphoserine phosphatase)
MEISGAEKTSVSWLRPDPDLAGMGFVDITGHAGITAFMRMAPAISAATTPEQVVDAYTDAVRRLRQAGEKSFALITLSTVGVEPGHYRITRIIGFDGLNRLPDSPWNHKDRLPVVSGGLMGRIIHAGLPALCPHLDLPDDPVLGDFLSQCGSMIAVPAFMDGKPTHWNFQFRREAGGFDADDLATAILRANMIGSNVRNVQVNQELRQLNEQMREDVKRIAQIQHALLPENLPLIAGLDIAASYQMYDQAGGDIYDFVSLGRADGGRANDPEGRWVILVGDVSGHGPAAAVVMAMLHAILRTFPRAPKGPHELLRYANHHLVAKQIENSFVTALLGIYDPPTRRFSYARAGHPPPIVKSGEKLIQLDDAGDLPLGIIADTPYICAQVTFEPGETLVLYTDGITEAAGPDGNDFGVEGVKRALSCCDGTPNCVIETITEQVQKHQKGIHPNDDQTILAIRAI